MFLLLLASITAASAFVPLSTPPLSSAKESRIIFDKRSAPTCDLRRILIADTDTRCIVSIFGSRSAPSISSAQRSQINIFNYGAPTYKDLERRSVLATLVATTSSLAFPQASVAAKGAAEYDLEYYARDLLFGNKLEGNLAISKGPPPHPPRRLSDPLLSLLLDDELKTCIPITELSQITLIPVDTLSEQAKLFRTKSAPAFQTSHPYNEEKVSDEYYFDLTCYSLWRVATSAIQDYSKRDTYIRNIGRRILDELLKRELISKKSLSILESNKSISLTDTLPCIIDVLELFQSTKYCTSYRLGDKNDEFRTGLNTFDELDNEELLVGGSIDCLVSVLDPSTLGGALQITGEGSRFAPDLVGPTLGAVWERVADRSVSVNFESYFVDPIYRPNPKVRV